MTYTPALDGLRAIAVMLVMAFHANTPFLKGGFLGVDVFFVLSGFLITCLLLSEVERTGTLEIWRFYKRRAYRLIPPLLFMLALYLALAPYAWPEYKHHIRDALLAAAYVSDYSKALFNAPNMLRHTWSLSIEEHFYLIWPLVILALRGRSAAFGIALLAAMYVAATAWRLFAAGEQPWMMVYPRFDTRISGLILGGLLALTIRRTQLQNVRVGLLPALAVLSAVILANQWKDLDSLRYGVMAAEVATALVLLAVVRPGANFRWLASPILVYLGRLSYGIYLFHFPIMLYLRTRFGWQETLLVGAIAATSLAAISYHTVEAWARRRKDACKSGAATVCTP